jgi:hypothetical protein
VEPSPSDGALLHANVAATSESNAATRDTVRNEREHERAAMGISSGSDRATDGVGVDVP